MHKKADIWCSLHNQLGLVDKLPLSEKLSLKQVNVAKRITPKLLSDFYPHLPVHVHLHTGEYKHTQYNELANKFSIQRPCYHKNMDMNF